MNTLEAVPELIIGVVIEGVEVASDCAGEEHRVLGNDGQARSEVVELDLGDIETVNADGARASLQEAEERQGQGGFTGTSTSNNTNALIAVDGEGKPLEDWWQISGVCDNEIIDLDAAFCGPGRGRAVAIKGFGG